MSTRPTIFVMIASYRDAETYPTVIDLFEKAKYPENVHVALCWQYNTLRDEPFQLRDRRHQISVIDMDYKKAKGACWARHVAQKLYNNETYYLQIDGHSRFIPDWDEELITELNACPSEWPILSTYPNHYTLPSVINDSMTYKLIFNTFHVNVPSFHSRPCTPEETKLPTPTAIVSGGFLFSTARAMLDVPYDPFIYFIGEEITMSVRYWTHGYDIFTPTKPFIFHLYVDPAIPKIHHWQDHPDWHESFEKYSRERVLHLLGIETTHEQRALRDIDHYGLGKVRTLEQYQKFAGVDFKGQTYSDKAKQGLTTPLE